MARREHELRAPMTEVTLRHVKGLMKKRGGYRDLSRDAVETEVHVVGGGGGGGVR